MPPLRTEGTSLLDSYLAERSRIYDSASPYGAGYPDDIAGDELAAEAREALAAALHTSNERWPDGASVGAAYFGKNQNESPSVVWTAQALGVLFEVGFLPGAPCVLRHLETLSKRFSRENMANPGTTSATDPWLLRTRHVAWALAMLAELPRHEAIEDDDETTRAAFARYRELVRRAYACLDGEEDAGREWLGLQGGELWWSEYWELDEFVEDERYLRRPNLLNTVYASMAIARAERHGLQIPRRRWSARRPLPDHVIGQLAAQIVVGHVATKVQRGPRAHLDPPPDHPWFEKWAAGQELPCGIVGLLCLFLLEYAYLLRQTNEPEAALWHHMLAQRLGHELVSRSAKWVDSIDVFSWGGKMGRAGWWHVPSYSTCLRAVLESEVVGPGHPVVEAAIKTIVSTERTVAALSPIVDGTVDRVAPNLDAAPEKQFIVTWADVARGLGKLGPSATWHRRVPLSKTLGKLENVDQDATPMSIHSAVMAYASLRRARWRANPRRPAADGRWPASPFATVTLEGDTAGKMITLVLAGCGYEERHQVDRGWGALLWAMGQDGAQTTRDIGESISGAFPGVKWGSRSGTGPFQAIRDLNGMVGIALIEFTIPKASGTSDEQGGGIPKEESLSRTRRRSASDPVPVRLTAEYLEDASFRWIPEPLRKDERAPSSDLGHGHEAS